VKTCLRGIRAVGFDLGETLLTYRDTPLSWVSLYRAALTSVAGVCNSSPIEEQFLAAEAILVEYNTRLNPRIKEIPAEEIFRHILNEWQLPSDVLPAAIEVFFRFFQQRLIAYDETCATLTTLRERGFKIGVLTDVPYGMPRAFVQHDLADGGIISLIDQLLTSVDVGFRKPEPRGFLALAESLGILPAEMIYIGNEPKDVVGANAAGIFSILIDREKRGAQHGQRATIHSFSEIVPALTT